MSNHDILKDILDEHLQGNSVVVRAIESALKGGPVILETTFDGQTQMIDPKDFYKQPPDTAKET